MSYVRQGLVHAPSRDLPATGTVIVGRLSDPVFATAARDFFDRMAAGARPSMPSPKIDWSVSKEENLRRQFAEIDHAFGKGAR